MEQHQLDRIEQKQDKLIEKIEMLVERNAKNETSIHWLKWVLSGVVAGISTLALAVAKYIQE